MTPTHNDGTQIRDGVACVGSITGCAADTAWGDIMTTKRASKRNTVPETVPPTSDIESSDAIVESAELVGHVPETEPEPEPVPAWITAFTATFPKHVGPVPAWVDPMCRTFDAAWSAAVVDGDGVLRDRNAITFDGWIALLNAADPAEPPARGHRYTMGSGADIARTQNAIYIAFMLAGIPWKRIPAAFGAAAWRFVLGATKCDYRSHADYFVSTFGRFVAHDHNDTTGLVNIDAENAARAWRDAKPAADESDAA